MPILVVDDDADPGRGEPDDAAEWLSYADVRLNPRTREVRRGARPLHVYLGYLRRKIEAEGGSRLLHTVRGVGFVLREDPL
jgi:two-component system response regulator MprA